MDSLIAASARALAAGDALGALKHVALRDDPPALALRGIAMAQLGELLRARELLRHAARGFGAHEELARARCVVAEAEVALAERDIGGSPRALTAALATLEAHADRANAVQARLIAARRLLLLGRLEEAETALAQLDTRGLSASLAAVAELTIAELALRSLRVGAARQALARAQEAARQARVPALLAEVADMQATLDRPAARRLCADGQQALRLDAVAALLAPASHTLVIDACRRGIGAGVGIGVGAAWQSLARRPILFSLARALAEAWPEEIGREALTACASKSAVCARLSRHWRRSRRHRAVSFSSRSMAVPSRYCCRRLTATRHRWWHCSPMALHGRHPRWHWRLMPASVRCSAHWPNWKPKAGCARSDGRARNAG